VRPASLHERLGLAKEQMGGLDQSLAGPVLPEADSLFDKSFELAKNGELDPANLVLAAALLAQAKESAEGRLSSALSLLARLVANADPKQTLGAEGHAFRDQLIPNGWRYMAKTWPRLRYAWREGLAELLGVPEDDPVRHALDEVTRLSPHEPEPVSVSIAETFPAPKTAFAFTLLGLGFAGWGIWTTMQQNQRMGRIENHLKRRR
jgi:hypothetical protein